MGYVADASKLKPGSVVKVEKPQSSTGTATHPHFFIVLHMPERPQTGDCLLLVGVSSTIASDVLDPARHIAMKWHAGRSGDSETGFFKPCYACVEFTHVLEVREGEEFALEVNAEFQKKFIRAEKLRTLVAAVNAWASKNRRAE